MNTLENIIRYKISNWISTKYLGLKYVLIDSIKEKLVDEEYLIVLEVEYTACFSLFGTLTCYKGLAIFRSQYFSPPVLDYITLEDKRR